MDRGHEAFVGACRRHPDVDDRYVRPVQPNAAQQSRGVLRLADDVDAGLL